jgi:hypothetical protein
MNAAETAFAKKRDDETLQMMLKDDMLHRYMDSSKTTNLSNADQTRIEGFRRSIMAEVHSAKDLASLSVEKLTDAGMTEEEAKKYRFHNTCTFCCMRNIGDPNRGNSLMRHDPAFWQDILAVKSFYWDLSDDGKRTWSGRVLASAGMYFATLAWKILLYFKLTFGVWDEELIEEMEIKYRSQQFDLNPDDDDMKHEDMIKSVGESHSLAWQILPYCTIVAKLGEAMNESPIFVFDTIVKIAIQDTSSHRGPWVHGGPERLMELNDRGNPLEEGEVTALVQVAGSSAALDGADTGEGGDANTAEVHEEVAADVVDVDGGAPTADLSDMDANAVTAQTALEDTAYDPPDSKFTLNLREPFGMRLVEIYSEQDDVSVLVSIVRSESQCARAGLEPGCKIISVGGMHATSILEVKYTLAAHQSEGEVEVVFSKAEIEPISKLPELDGKFSVIPVSVEAPPDFWGGAEATNGTKEIPFAELDDDHPEDSGRGVLVWFDRYPPGTNKDGSLKPDEKVPDMMIGYTHLPTFCARPLHYVYVRIKRLLGWGFSENYVTFYMSEVDRRKEGHKQAFEATFWGTDQKVRGKWGKNNLPTELNPLFIDSQSLTCDLLYNHPSPTDEEWTLRATYLKTAPLVLKTGFKMRLANWLAAVGMFISTGCVCITTDSSFFGMWAFIAVTISVLNAIVWARDADIPKPDMTVIGDWAEEIANSLDSVRSGIANGIANCCASICEGAQRIANGIANCCASICEGAQRCFKCLPSSQLPSAPDPSNTVPEGHIEMNGPESDGETGPRRPDENPSHEGGRGGGPVPVLSGGGEEGPLRPDEGPPDDQGPPGPGPDGPGGRPGGGEEGPLRPDEGPPGVGERLKRDRRGPPKR